MKNNSETCGRAEELVAYLYGEASEREAVSFARHMEDCAACRDEAAAFKKVRAGVVEWRNHSLPSFAATPNIAHAFAAAESTRAQKRSAFAAISEFFSLSPLWMRAATAAAAVLVCALLVFTATRMFSEPRMVIVRVAPTQAEVDALVKQEMEKIRQQEQLAQQNSASNNSDVQAPKENAVVKPEKAPRQVSSPATVAKRQRRETPGQSTAPQEVRQQLAELVQSSTREDDSLPRLSDLLEDASGDN